MGNCVSPTTSQKGRTSWNDQYRKSTPLPKLDVKSLPKVRANTADSEASSPGQEVQGGQFPNWGSRTISSGALLGKFEATRSSSPSHLEDSRTSPAGSECLPSVKLYKELKQASYTTTGNFILLTHQDFKKNFVFSKKLGQGQFGSVRLCFSKYDPQIRFAVKSMSVQDKTKNYEQISKEVDALNYVDHPYIIKFYDTIEDLKFFHLVMEYVDGETIFQNILRDGPLKEDHAQKVIRQLVHAITHLHSHGLVHRDLKPENVLFTNEKKDSIKLIDLGLSKHQRRNTLSTIVGTPLYIAPEVFSKNYDKKCDLWSIGIMTYFILSGAVPFVGESASEIYKQAKLGNINFEDSSWKYVSQDAKDFIRNLLEIDQDKRVDGIQALQSKWLKEEKQSDILEQDSVAKLVSDFQEKPISTRLMLILFARFMSDFEIKSVSNTYLNNNFYLLPFSHFSASYLNPSKIISKARLWVVFKQLAIENVITEESLIEKLSSKTFLGINECDIKQTFNEMAIGKPEVDFDQFKSFVQSLVI